MSELLKLPTDLCTWLRRRPSYKHLLYKYLRGLTQAQLDELREWQTRTDAARKPKQARDTHCQICERAILANTGLIAHHGYQRPGHGWQTASCFGARYRPWEVACDALPPAIESLGKYIEHQREALTDLITNPPRGLHYERRDSLGNVRERPRSLLRPHGFSVNCDNNYTAGTYINEFHRTRGGLEQNIKGATEDLARLRARLAAWKPPVDMTA